VPTSGREVSRFTRRRALCAFLFRGIVQRREEDSSTGTSEPGSLRLEKAPSSALYTNGAVLLCATRFFVHGDRRSDYSSSRDGQYRRLRR